jgi:hypothetical protein
MRVLPWSALWKERPDLRPANDNWQAKQECT